MQTSKRSSKGIALLKVTAAIVAAVILFPGGCARPPSPGLEPLSQSKEPLTIAQELYDKGNYNEALAIYLSLLKNDPNGPKAAELRHKVALTYLGMGEYVQALGYFNEVFRRHPFYPLRQQAILEMADLQVRTGLYKDALYALLTLLDENPGRDACKRAHQLLAKVYSYMKDWEHALVTAHNAGLCEQGGDHQGLEEVLKAIPEDALKDVRRYFKGELRAEVELELIRRLIKEGKIQGALAAISQFLESHDAPIAQRKALELKANIIKEQGVDPLKVGVLLAGSGPMAEIGERLFSWIRLAQEEYGSNIRLEVYHTKTEQEVQKGVEYLVLNEKVICVFVGPLDGTGMGDAIIKAKEFNTPVIAFTQNTKLLDHSAGILGGVSSPIWQLDKLVTKAVNEMGFKRFGLIYPENHWGKALAQAYEKAILKTNGTLVYKGSYKGDEKEFSWLAEASLPLMDILFVADTLNNLSLVLYYLPKKMANETLVLGLDIWPLEDLVDQLQARGFKGLTSLPYKGIKNINGEAFNPHREVSYGSLTGYRASGFFSASYLFQLLRDFRPKDREELKGLLTKGIGIQVGGVKVHFDNSGVLNTEGGLSWISGGIILSLD